MNPKITVFMAAYNAANYINESIQSILDQTFEDFELLIVNDGSTDETVDIINNFKDSRIRLLHNDKNRGLTYTRNIVVNEARAEYIAILDSDDVAIHNRLELQYNFFQEHPDFALCGGHGTVIDEAGNPVADNRFTVPVGSDKIKMTLLFYNTFINSTVMYKAAVLKELNGYNDYAPAEDYELFIRISDKYPVANLDSILVKYRLHSSNTSLVQSETGRAKVHSIKEKQLTNLQITADKKLTDTFFSLLEWDYSASDFTDYLSLFTKLKAANKSLNKYPEIPFEIMLFNRWFEIICVKKAKMNALSLLLNKNIFKWSYVNFRQFRKAFKLSIRGIGQLST
ncbi:MAG TPA: glycosyltransferase family 2 protein [Pedobacter sp.]|uniref:glycosyltransferase family 2 protein n=1 Tax=Pedobacter sp. TaxID=1411316 RepID=UPI002BA2DF6E|nr:glycosyltransferase family 2 protein [Pedobacter sp.]HMI04321.1 glycosyltransferase family 2 protein [Pedobacter sp.]